MNCVLCQMPGDPESPWLTGLVHELNPRTSRYAWMHGDCLQVAIEDMNEDDRSDYYEKMQGVTPETGEA